jgi:hypothetical protein
MTQILLIHSIPVNAVGLRIVQSLEGKIYLQDATSTKV